LNGGAISPEYPEVELRLIPAAKTFNKKWSCSYKVKNFFTSKNVDNAVSKEQVRNYININSIDEVLLMLKSKQAG
jgi:hypothetical protein